MSEQKTNKKHSKMQKRHQPQVASYTMRSAQPPIAMRMRTQLKWVERNTITGVAITDYQYRLNSLYDPNFTGAGHQPKGFDQLAAFYQRYRVYKTWWHVQVLPSVGRMGVVTAPTNSVSGYSNLDDAREAAFAKSTVCTTTQYGSVRGSIDLAELNGKTRIAYEADDTTQALCTTNPSENLQLHVVFGHLDGATNCTWDYWIQIVFDVEFSDPVELGQS